jgi:hypothetical protein
MISKTAFGERFRVLNSIDASREDTFQVSAKKIGSRESVLNQPLGTGKAPGARSKTKILGVLCLFILASVLVAGLWPFHSPTNDVTWLTGANGLRLGHRGTLLTSGTFDPKPSQEDWSLEIWIRPSDIDASSTLIAFYTPGGPQQFSLRQSRADFEMRSEIRSAGHPTKKLRRYVDNVFHDDQTNFITITTGSQGSAVYVDGVLTKTFREALLSNGSLSGNLVLGTSPVKNDSWPGDFRGLAIYPYELGAAQASEHYQAWTRTGRPRLDVAETERPMALFLFNEHSGNVIHNLGSSGIDLHVPEKYMILREKFLEPPWDEFSLELAYWKSALINVAGFIPFGFIFYAFLLQVRRIGRPVLVTLILGLSASLTIEILQTFLPTRDSGMTDLITNTMGTGLGIMVYRWNPAIVAKTLERVL